MHKHLWFRSKLLVPTKGGVIKTCINVFWRESALARWHKTKKQFVVPKFRVTIKAPLFLAGELCKHSEMNYREFFMAQIILRANMTIEILKIALLLWTYNAGKYFKDEAVLLRDKLSPKWVIEALWNNQIMINLSRVFWFSSLFFIIIQWAMLGSFPLYWFQSIKLSLLNTISMEQETLRWDSENYCNKITLICYQY